jgi:hypothetical protein
MHCQRSAALALAAAGIALAAAGCGGHITPLGPDQAASVPQPHRLRSALVLRAMHILQQHPVSGCPAGWGALGPGPGCYREAGTPATITAAGVSAVISFRPPQPPGQTAVPVQYGFWISVPAASVAALSAVIPAAAGSPGPPTAQPVTSAATIPALSMAGRTWLLIGFTTRYADREVEVFLPSRSQALRVQRALAARG